MCGIVGFLGNKNTFLLNQMTELISHRGPDQDIKIEKGLINIGFRRLSINDLVSGNQPFYDEKNKIGIFCNGEIYNHIDLRKDLENKNYKFKSKNDCEVILHGFNEYGLDFISKINGMFFILIWDEIKEKIYLIRDRLGIKPCYYININNEIYFSSEIKPLLENKKLKRTLNYNSINFYLSTRYTPSSNNLIKEIKTLKPGSILEFTSKRQKINKYWDHNFIGKENDNFKSLLENSTNLRMTADVKVGVFLSGGIDSSVITSLMSNKSKDFEIFTHSFDIKKDESIHAIRLCKELGLKNHNIVHIKKEDIYNLENIISSMEFPIGNSDIIGLDKLCYAAKEKNTKVILSGEGSDEVFGSYIHHNLLNKFKFIKSLINLIKINKLVSSTTKILPKNIYNVFFDYGKYKVTNELINNFSNFLSERDEIKSYINLISLFNLEEKQKILNKDFYSFLEKEIDDSIYEDHFDKRLNLPDKVLKFEINNWLTDYHLIKEDKISMRHSIEMRFPFLDHNIHEFMNLRKNKKYKFNNKKILKKIFKNHIPNFITERKKGPILVPIIETFDKQFIELYRDILTKTSINKTNIFNFENLEILFKDFESNKNYVKANKIFAILSLHIWLKKFL